MDQLVQIQGSMIQKLQLMDDFIALSMRREEIAGPIGDLAAKVASTHKLLKLAREKLNKELKNIEEEIDQLTRRMRAQQAIILDYLYSERKRKILNAESEEKHINILMNKDISNFTTPRPNSAIKCLPRDGTSSKCLLSKFSKMTVVAEGQTPKMTIKEYIESPLVKRNKLHPIPFNFAEFEVQITPEQFQTIPKYMRGRVTIEELSNFMESTIIPCFNEKYQLLHRQRNVVRNPIDLDLWKLYNEQASYVPGRNFITPGDISRKINKMIDKKLQNYIIMLRHIGVLQEQRCSQAVCYVWTTNIW